MGLSFGEGVAGEMRPGGFRAGGSRWIRDRRRRTPWRLRGFAAYPLRVPWLWRAMERRSNVGRRAGRGSVAPPGLVFMGGRHPALTRWATFWRPSGPGATAWARGGVSVSCCWCPLWLHNGGGLNHEAHNGHERRMGEFKAMGQLSRPATTTLWLGVGWDVDPGLSSFLVQPWATRHNAFGVGVGLGRTQARSGWTQQRPSDGSSLSGSEGRWGQSRSRGKVQLGASKEGPRLSGTIEDGADPG